MSDELVEKLHAAVRPQCEAFEAQRATYRRQVVRTSLALVAVAAAGSLLFDDLLIYGLCALTGAGIVIAVVAGIRSSRLTGYYKTAIMPEIVARICPGATYSPDEGIPYAMFAGSDLFRTPDRYSSEDMIAGTIGLTKFQFSEVQAEEKIVTHTKNGTQTRWQDIFRGFLFIADFNKDFRGRTTLTPRGPLGTLFGGSDRVKLENPEFMKRFDIRSTDQVEARYILSPSLMERLVALSDKYGRGLRVSFTRSLIVVAIPSGTDHYEASVWRSITSHKALQRDILSILNLTAIVDELNMNTRIWSKR